MKQPKTKKARIREGYDMIEVYGVKFRSYNHLLRCTGLTTPVSRARILGKYGTLEEWVKSRYEMSDPDKLRQVLEYAKFNYENNMLAHKIFGSTGIMTRTLMVRALNMLVSDRDELQAMAAMYGKGEQQVKDTIDDLIRRISTS